MTHDPRSWWRVRWLPLAVTPALSLLPIFVLAFVVYLDVGEWPGYGTPDPKRLLGLFIPLYALTWFGLLAGFMISPVLVLTGFGGLAMGILRRQSARALLWPALEALSGSAVLSWWWADPLHLLEWFAD